MKSRKALLTQTQKYFKQNNKSEKFVAGKTYIPVTVKTLDAEDLCALVDSSLDLWLTAGRFTEKFEPELAKHLGQKTPTLFVNSGSSANLLAVSCLKSKQIESTGLAPLVDGDEVITLASGFPTTINPILQNQLKPVFIDIDLKTLNATVEQVAKAISPKTRAVILAHTLGNPFRADLIRDLCKKNKLFLIEDCCDALGATVKDEKVGSFGDYSTCSFYPAHHITTGEGGAVGSKNQKLRRIAESFRDWGRDCWCALGHDNTCKKRFGWKLGSLPEGYDHKYIYSHIGYNLKATDMQAAIGLSQLQKLEKFVSARRKNWAALYKGVTSSPRLRKAFIPIEPTPETNPSWFGFPIRCADGIQRTKITKALEEKKIGTRVLFGGNITRHPAYQGIPSRIVGDLKNSDTVMNSVFWIGVHPQISKAQIQYMLENLEGVL